MVKEDGVARLVMGGQMLESISGVTSERIKCLGWGYKCCGHRQIGGRSTSTSKGWQTRTVCHGFCLNPDTLVKSHVKHHAFTVLARATA